MFLKPFRIKSQSQLKGTEKKKLSSELLNNFPNLTNEEISTIIHTKFDVSVTKALCHKGEIAHIYQIQKEPLLFKIDKDETIYPTVYLLWKLPKLLHHFTTHHAVISKLQQGADLMLPGIIVGENVNINSYGKFEKGKMVSVNSDKNFCPILVGKTALSSHDMYMSARQGKGVIVLHIYQDYLWEMGSKTLVSQISEDFFKNEISKEKDETSVDLEEQTQSLSLIEIEEDSNGPKITSEYMDELFNYCFLKVLKTQKKLELPILTSNFYRLHMVNVCPVGSTLDIKKSTYKKLSKFLNSMAKDKLIEIKEFPKGVENIVAINHAHKDIKGFILEEDDVEVSPKAESEVSTKDNFVPPVLEEVYVVSGPTIKFFQKNGLKRGQALTKQEIKEIVTSYIEENNLKKNNTVEVDPLIHEAVVGPKEGYKEFLKWDEIFSRLMGKMSPATRITRKGYEPNIEKGKLKPIEIAVAKRSGNKKVTLIYNVHQYGIDENEFAHQIQVGVATSTSVTEAENKPIGTVQILVQGNQVAYVGKLLLEKYNLHRKYIRGLELAVKSKR